MKKPKGPTQPTWDPAGINSYSKRTFFDIGVITFDVLHIVARVRSAENCSARPIDTSPTFAATQSSVVYHGMMRHTALDLEATR